MKAKSKKIAPKSNGVAKKSKKVFEKQESEDDIDMSDIDVDDESDVEVDSEDEFDSEEDEELNGEVDSDDELNGEVDSDDEDNIGSQDDDDSENDGDSDNQEGQGSDDDDWLEGKSHKKALSNLQKTDPEFYKYLQENDKKLLQFHESDSEKDDEDDDDKHHVPPNELEIDSDESDYEEEGDKRGDNVVTLAMVKEWRENLISNPSSQSINKAIEVFHAALDRVTGDDAAFYKVEGSAVFNTVIEMCVMHLQPAVVAFLKLTPTSIKHPEKAKRWVKVKSSLQGYFNDLFKLLEGVASEHIITVMLKHLHTSCSFVACFQKLSKSAVKHLTKLWSTGEETVRVLAYLCILRLTTLQKSSLLNHALKLMYIAYIRSSKFVSINTLPQINFMKQTLVDLFSLEPQLSYQHAFLYIRQLAIHLRNAITIHKKENFQTVYNWQYIHSLKLWVDLMCAKQDSPELQQLVYPLVQIILGCVKLIPTSQYMPLRFHCIQILIKLGTETNTYIPVLPLILESLTKVDLNKQLKKASMKPFDFTFVLRVSKGAMTETAFTDAIVEYSFQLLIESAASYSHMITFPDLFVPAVMQLKNFVKNCKVSKYSAKLKQALVKIEENVKTINTHRNKLSLNLNETSKIKAFETEMKAKETPLQKYWLTIKKSSGIKKAKQATNNDRIASQGMQIPKIIKSNKRKIQDDGPAELFPSDESDFEFPDVDAEEKPKKKKKTKKETSKKPKREIEEEQDVDSIDEDDLVEELDINNF